MTAAVLVTNWLGATLAVVCVTFVFGGLALEARRERRDDR